MAKAKINEKSAAAAKSWRNENGGVS